MLCKLISIRLRGLLGKVAGKQSKWLKLVIVLALAYAVAGSGVLMYLLFSELAGPLSGTPLAWFYFAMVGLLSFGLSFFFTAFAAKSELFEAKDTELLLSLPLKPRTILLSRLSILLLSEYLFSFLIMVPAGIAWALHDGLSFLPTYLLGSLFLPLLSAALASVVGWLLALLTANARRKNLLTVLFSLAFMGIYSYVYMNIGDYITQILTLYDKLADGMMGWGFLFHWYGLGVAQADLLRIFAVGGISIATFALAVWLISHGFLRISSRTSHRGKKPVRYRESSVEKALFVREFRRLFSSPVYFLNCALGVVMLLLIAVFLLFKGDFLRTMLEALPFSSMKKELLCALLLSLPSAMCTFTAVSISLEGKQLWIIRSAPIDARKVLNAKLLFHLSLTTPSILIVSLVGGVILSPSPSGWVLILLLPQLANLLCAQFGLLMNLRFPKFNWTNETEPVKQSLPVFLALTVPAIMTLALSAVLVFANPDAKLYSLSVILFLTLLNTLCTIALTVKAPERFDTLA